MLSFKKFEPNYQNIVDAACNRKPQRIPLYEHNISYDIISLITGQPMVYGGTLEDKRAFFTRYCLFFRQMGYDTVSFENCITEVLPGGGALAHHIDPVIKTREDFDAYDFDGVVDRYFEVFSESFELVRECMPEGMKAIGGPGNGLFEIVQDLVGYTGLCYLSFDDPDLYSDLFSAVTDMTLHIWERFMREYGDIYCVLRFGDDLGFKSQTLLPEDDIRQHIIPNYRKFTDLVHSYGKPFLLHSCGCIFNVMDDIITLGGVDAKHSNEDGIAPFSRWINDYGSRIGNFGGIDTNIYCCTDRQMGVNTALEVCRLADAKNGGVAIGCGNSIPSYVDVQQYVAIIEAVRRYRGD